MTRRVRVPEPPHTNILFVMFYVYVLQSVGDDQLYIGSTSDLKRRLTGHNAGDVRSTQHRRPFTLLYYEAYLAEHDARVRERQLKKRGQTRGHLKRRLTHSLQRTK